MSRDTGSAVPGDAQQPRSYRGGFSALKNSASQVVGISKVATRLGPKQIKDEVQIAVLEMKNKGIKLGVGAGLLAGALVFLLLAVITLLVAAAAGLAIALGGRIWLAALLIAALFILILVILALVGIAKIKAQLPLKPESAIFGLLYDLGVAKEGSGYTATRVRREQKQKQEAKEAEKAEEKRRKDSGEVPEEPKPNQSQLEDRTNARRDHLKSLRDDLGSQVNRTQAQAGGLAGKTKADAKDVPNRAKGAASGFATNVSNPEGLKARWKPLTALAVSLGAFATLLARLFKRD